MNMDDFILGAIAGAAVLAFAAVVFILVSAGPKVMAIIFGPLAFIAICGLIYAAIKGARRGE